MGKSIKLNNNVYWDSTAVVINGNGTSLGAIFEGSAESTTQKIKNDCLNIDQTYNASSTNAQSGVAVAAAIAAAITTALNTPV